MAQLFLKRVLSVCQAYRDEIAAELGEIQATFLLLWLSVVAAVLMVLMVFCLL